MGRALATLATIALAPAAAIAVEPGSVAAFPPLPEEDPAPAPAAPPGAQPAPAAPPPAPVGTSTWPSTEPPASPPPVAAPPPPLAAPPQAFPSPVPQQPAPMMPAQAPAPASSPPAAPDRDQLERDQQSSEAWMVALEAFTRVPLDMGVQAGLEFPMGLRVSAGYGFVPGPYLDFFTQSLADSAGVGNSAAALLREGMQGGKSWRLQAGLRPWRDLGFYFDAGFAHFSLDGEIDGESLRGVAPGTYQASVGIDTWLLEVGYQAWVDRHFTLAAGLGLSGTMSSNTELTGDGLDRQQAESIAETADGYIEDFGVLPTLTLRLGFDVI